ncbi:MAG: UvrD-helicase domain-containing protein [Treponema sp.]|nr:UvrD-helicase domain-containing protein [Treponema sp.]
MDNTNSYPYLSILEKELDPHQSKVCFETKNTVVSAGAGSGKTQVLATRFAWLVISQKIRVNEILTLTFTNKAAAEMYQRIYLTLKEFAFHKERTEDDFKRLKWKPDRIERYRKGFEDLTEDKRSLAKQALDEFAGAHIQTLDSYIGSLLRQCANRYGLKPDFSTGGADSASAIRENVLRTLIKYADNPGIKSFCAPGEIESFAKDKVAKIIIGHTTIATPENYFTIKFKTQCSLITHVWNYLIAGNDWPDDGSRNIVSDTSRLSEYKSNIEDTLNSSDKKDDPKKKAYVESVENLLSAAEKLMTEEGISTDDISSKSGHLESVLEKFDVFVKAVETASATSNAIQTVKSVVGKLKGEWVSIANQITEFILQYDDLKSFYGILDTILSETNNLKRQSGSLTFNDVTSMAQKILIENEDIRNQEKRAYKKIMIDEFQDNNGMNRDLLYLLSLRDGEFESEDGTCRITFDENKINSLHDAIVEKRDAEKLFFVGDEKQSIYKFRNADVSVFRGLTKENTELSMTFNYRSTPELVKSFNMLFSDSGGIFDSSRSDVEYEAVYKQDAEKNGSVLPDLEKNNVPVHVCMVDEGPVKADSSGKYFPQKEQQVYFVAKKISDMINEARLHPIQEDGKENPDAKFSSYAILVKSRTDYAIIQRYMNMMGINYELDEFKNIFEAGPVSDIYNFLRICVYPSDTKSFACYLTSPLAGLSEISMEKILSNLVDIKHRNADEDDFVFNPFDTSFDRVIEKDIGPGEWKKFSSARNFYKDKRKIVLQQRLTKTLTMLWNERGYKYETMLTPQTELYAEQFDLMFEMARTTEEGGKSIGWFVDELKNLQKAQKKDDSDIDASQVSYPLERPDAVQIMTIHKSKGLQFRHVFILGCTSVSPKSDDKQMFFDETTGLSVCHRNGKGNFFLERQKKLEEAMELAEFRRLIYVAITRAENDVHILGCWEERDKSSTKFRLIKNAVKNFYGEEKDPALYTERQYEKTAGFDYQLLQPVEYQALARKNENPDEIRKKVISRIPDFDEKNVRPPYETHPVKRVSPSHMEPELSDDGFRPGKKSDLYKDLSLILAKKSAEGDSDNTEEKKESEDEMPSIEFQPADFGTLVHDCLSRLAEGVTPEKYAPPRRLLKNLTETEIEQIKEICVRMCRHFAESGLGHLAKQAIDEKRFLRSEYAFSMFADGSLFHGSIDLIFETEDGNYIMVDYKTDREVEPFRHYKQQACYLTAAKEILPHPGEIRSFLYYLRFDEAVEISEKCREHLL